MFSISSAIFRNVSSLRSTKCLKSLSLCFARYSSKKKAVNRKVQDLVLNMPKQVDITELQKIRKVRRVKARKYPPSTVYLQVLGSGAPGAPKSLYVFTEQARFLFNCGEGTQRLAYEHKVKLGMMEHILVTHKSWSNVGGLPGILLTIQDNGVPEITLHGPPGIASLPNDTRNFIQFRNMNINYNHYSENDGIFGEANDPLTIQAVPIWAKLSTEEEAEEHISADETEAVEDLFAYERSRRYYNGYRKEDEVDPVIRKQRLEESRRCRNVSIAYICRPPPKAGHLLLEKCVVAGVPPGPLLGDLKRGQDVTLPNGKVVLASDVTEPQDPGPVFIIVEAPSFAYLDSLLANEKLAKYQDTSSSESDLMEVVVHFTPSHVMQDPRYQEWMGRFPSKTSHLCLNDSNSCMGSEAIHRIQYKLNLISEQIFPLLKDQSIPLQEKENGDDVEKNGHTLKGNNDSLSDNKNSVDTPTENTNKNCSVSENSQSNISTDSRSNKSKGSVYQGKTLMMYHIRPNKKIDRSNNLLLTPETYIEECYAVETFKSALAQTKSKMNETNDILKTSETFPKITFLGTGSCIPNKTRNTSGILVNLSSEKTLIMDCGEGTYGQLVRLLGLPLSDKTLRHLAAVYVSHLHADHHMGFIQLLLARRQAFKRAGIESIPKLLLLAPKKILSYLVSYNSNFESILQDFTLVSNHNFLPDRGYKLSSDYRKICSQLDMKAIDETYVIHCANSFGVAWTHINGWKLAYSGDTMPCNNFVKIGKDCDLLIHEATMEDELEEDAKIKTHSTISQAIKVGRDMNAKHTILTHFSQRYAKIPLLPADVPENVGIAFDNMTVGLETLPTLHYLYSAAVAMFAEDMDLMLEKARKRTVKENRLLELKDQEKEEKRLEHLSKKLKTAQS